MRVRLERLPEHPPLAHDYYAIDEVWVDVQMPARARPVALRCKVAGEGPPLVLIHGLMTSSYSFRYVLRTLAAHHRVIAPDLPGAGQSEAPLDLPMDPRTCANVIRGLLDALGVERPYVVGNSLGGYLSLWLAVLHPGRLSRLMVMHEPGFPELRLHALKWAMAVPGVPALYRWLVTRSPEEFA